MISNQNDYSAKKSSKNAKTVSKYLFEDSYRQTFTQPHSAVCSPHARFERSTRVSHRASAMGVGLSSTTGTRVGTTTNSVLEKQFRSARFPSGRGSSIVTRGPNASVIDTYNYKLK